MPMNPIRVHLGKMPGMLRTIISRLVEKGKILVAGICDQRAGDDRRQGDRRKKNTGRGPEGADRRRGERRIKDRRG